MYGRYNSIICFLIYMLCFGRSFLNCRIRGIYYSWFAVLLFLLIYKSLSDNTDTEIMYKYMSAWLVLQLKYKQSLSKLIAAD